MTGLTDMARADFKAMKVGRGGGGGGVAGEEVWGGRGGGVAGEEVWWGRGELW